MSKIAKLVMVSLMTRVIVEDTASEEEILNEARGRFHNIVENDLIENLESIDDDTECPYEDGEEYKDKYGHILKIDDDVEMPIGSDTDTWQYAFVGCIDSFHHGAAVVRDGDDEYFTIDCERLEKYFGN
jgi:hypothetical protein